MTSEPRPLTDEEEGFTYFECPECGFDSVQPKINTASLWCPLCAGDSNHDVLMRQRVCRTTDKPEGRDARKAWQRVH